PRRAQSEDRVEGQTLVGPAEDVRDQDQMAGGGHGEQLRQPLDYAEHDSLEVAHPTTSSPPSTPMTFPVIQCVSGRASTTMARATSSGVVRRPLGLVRWALATIASWPGIFWRAGVR